ncbi:alpha/beta fold hydrolase [Actinophytocola gossypii]|uniref:Alpha/beta fold hydrolase n=1 Tax=Actinophytocola gossypii TaxID=2812003 RepID=A0ABT2JC19_9PSEU|nr:alpha/beta fold hydrolase [Actinophytocola gossypii]MCT2585412.1 alpha/beta fold hydrolase [Actinophytocola gossypii]
MSRIGDFRSREHRERYVERYVDAMRVAPVPSKELDVDTAFGVTRVYRWGEPGGRPIVLLPGLSATAACWAPLVGDLSAEHPVYAVDTIGEPGMSVQTAPLRDHADRARWLDEVLAGLGIDDVHLVGGSSGGFYAVQQAIHAPERLGRVTLLDPTTVTVRFARSVMWIGLLATLVDRDPLWRLFLRRMAGGDVLDRADVRLILAGIRNFRARMPPQFRPPADRIAAIRVPVLALFAGRSRVHEATRAAARFRELLPEAEVELWPEADHLMWLTERNRRRIVDEILARSVSPSG